MSAGCAAGALFLLLPNSKTLIELRHSETYPFLIFLAALPPVIGRAIAGARGRQTDRQRRVSGLATGLILAATVAAIPLTNWRMDRLHQNRITVAAFGNSTDDWEIETDGSATVATGTSFSWNIPLKIPALPDEVRVLRADVEGVSMRPSPEADWQDYPGVTGKLVTEAENPLNLTQWRLILQGDQPVLDRMTSGELRVRLKGRMQPQEIKRIPMEEGAFTSGTDWIYKITGTGVTPDGRPFFNGMGRSINSWHPEAVPILEGPGPVRFEDHSTRELRIIGHVRTVLTRFAGTPSAAKKNPTHVLVRHFERPAAFERTVHLRGVRFKSPQSPVGETPLTTNDIISSPTARPLAAWPDNPAPAIPDASATEAEVAVYLTLLTRNNATNPLPERDTPENRAKLAALVPKWLPLFLEMAVRERQEDTFIPALIAGTPEEKRQEVLQRLSENPELVKVVTARGWESEAKSYVLKTVERIGFIPPEWQVLCRSYRDPSFHPFMRRYFAPSVPVVRYWESMPDLAPELPAKLSQVMESFRNQHVPGTTLNGKRVMLEALLYSGALDALDMVIRDFRVNSHRADMSWDLLYTFLRDAAGRKRSDNEKTFTEFIGSSTAADYRFDKARRLFSRKS